jgi:hypothetical protein
MRTAVYEYHGTPAIAARECPPIWNETALETPSIDDGHGNQWEDAVGDKSERPQCARCERGRWQYGATAVDVQTQNVWV